MTKKEKIELLKKYRSYLLYLKEYQKENNKNTILEKPKTLVLKRKYYGKDLIVG